jgi:hypothetical protein
MPAGTGYLMSPLGLRVAEHNPIAPRLGSLAGTRIGLLDNTKKNADRLLAAVGAILVRSHGVAEVVSRRKISSSPAAPDWMIDELTACDAVINAYGDCGSCTSWCVYDGVTLEKRGVPTATVNSDAFVVLGQQEAIALGLPGLPIVTVPHPMGDVAAGEVERRAGALVAQIVHVLTTKAGTLETEYTDRFIDESDRFTRAEMICAI